MRNRRLTRDAAPAKGIAMKNLLLIIAASASLMACEKEVIVEGGNKVAVDTSNVVLPPSISATKTYRCKDNSLVYIDWLSNGGARVKKNKTDATGTEIAAGSTELTGDAKSASITYKGQSCKG